MGVLAGCGGRGCSGVGVNGLGVTINVDVGVGVVGDVGGYGVTVSGSLVDGRGVGGVGVVVGSAVGSGVGGFGANVGVGVCGSSVGAGVGGVGDGGTGGSNEGSGVGVGGATDPGAGVVDEGAGVTDSVLQGILATFTMAFATAHASHVVPAMTGNPEVFAAAPGQVTNVGFAPFVPLVEESTLAAKLTDGCASPHIQRTKAKRPLWLRRRRFPIVTRALSQGVANTSLAAGLPANTLLEGEIEERFATTRLISPRIPRFPETSSVVSCEPLGNDRTSTTPDSSFLDTFNVMNCGATAAQSIVPDN